MSDTKYDQNPTSLLINICTAYFPMLQSDTKREHYHVHKHSSFCGYSYPNTRLDKPLRLQEVEALRTSKQSAYYGSKVVNPTHQSLLPPGDISGTHFCQRLSQPKGYSAARRIKSIRIPMTPSGIKPTSLRLVPQCLNQLHHCVPHSCCGYSTAFRTPTLYEIFLLFCITSYIVPLMQDTFFHELYFTVVLQINLTHFPRAKNTCSTPVQHFSNGTVKFSSSLPTHAEVPHPCVHGHDKHTIIYYSSVSFPVFQKLCTHSFHHQPHCLFIPVQL